MPRLYVIRRRDPAIADVLPGPCDPALSAKGRARVELGAVNEIPGASLEDLSYREMATSSPEFFTSERP